MHRFEEFNVPAAYDLLRTDEHWRSEWGELCRSATMIPMDQHDPQEERGLLVVSGRHRIGYDVRTHRAFIARNGEVVIAPLNV